MSTWTTISNAAVAVGGIPASSTVTALRDNPVAIAGAATGAPVVFGGWHPVDKVTIGDGKDGLIYDSSVNGTLAEIVTPDFEDGYEYRIVANALRHNSGSNRQITWEAYYGTSASYVSMFAHASIASNTYANAEIELLTPRLTKDIHHMRITASTSLFSPVLQAISGVAVQSPTFSNEKILKVRVYSAVAGSIDNGKIWLFRRREYASSP